MTNLYAKDAAPWGVNGHYYRLIPAFENNGWFGLKLEQALGVAGWGGQGDWRYINTSANGDGKGTNIADLRGPIVSLASIKTWNDDEYSFLKNLLYPVAWPNASATQNHWGGIF